jgi:hypothetical protein
LATERAISENIRDLFRSNFCCTSQVYRICLMLQVEIRLRLGRHPEGGEIMGTKPAPTLQVDPELARMSVGLHLASHFRLWVIARHLTRIENGSSKVSKRELKATIRHYNITYTRQYLNVLLRAGEGLFWNANRHDIYIRSRQFVAKQLTQRALEENRDLLLNKAGVPEVLLSPCGSLEQWESTIYAG